MVIRIARAGLSIVAKMMRIRHMLSSCKMLMERGNVCIPSPLSSLYTPLPLLTFSPTFTAESSQSSAESITEEEEHRAAAIASRWQKVALSLVIAFITLCQV